MHALLRYCKGSRLRWRRHGGGVRMLLGSVWRRSLVLATTASSLRAMRVIRIRQKQDKGASNMISYTKIQSLHASSSSSPLSRY
jgi:hypothetical protein